MLTYSSLREIQKKELESGALVELEADFYSSVRELLLEKAKQAKEGTILAVREYENLKRIISLIQARREEKIVLMALRSEKSHIGLTTEEKEIFLKFQQLVADHRKKIVLERDKNPPLQKIRILEPVEKYTGVDNKTYGPFEKGEQHSIPKKEAEWLLREKMAEMVI